MVGVVNGQVREQQADRKEEMILLGNEGEGKQNGNNKALKERKKETCVAFMEGPREKRSRGCGSGQCFLWILFDAVFFCFSLSV